MDSYSENQAEAVRATAVVRGIALPASRRKRKWLKWTLAGVGVAGLTFLAVSWMLFQHVPSWYRPLEVPPDQVQAVQSDLARMADTLNERMVRANEPFQIRVTQQQLNAWIAAREDMWPLSREWLPEGVSDPFVAIEPDGIRVAATVQQGAVQTVLSIQLSLRADEEQIGVQLLEVSSGSLPIPHSWVESQLVRFQKQASAHLKELNGEGTRKNIQISDLFEGISFPNRGVWRQVDVPPRSYRVIGLALEPGALTATIRPAAQRGSAR